MLGILIRYWCHCTCLEEMILLGQYFYRRASWMFYLDKPGVLTYIKKQLLHFYFACNLCVCVCVCVCMCVCVYIYTVHTHTYTYMHAYIHTENQIHDLYKIVHKMPLLRWWYADLLARERVKCKLIWRFISMLAWCYGLDGCTCFEA